MPRALVALAIGAFAIGCTEFVIMGLLPQIGADLHASVPAMGMLITAYAIGVLVGAPVLTALAAVMGTRPTLITLAAIFTVGNLLAAGAVNYDMMLLARLVTALAHGSFFGVGAIAARRLVAPDKATQAIALMFVGLTFANIAGVPLSTFVGQHVSWRFTFAGIAALGVVTMAALRAFLPDDPTRINLRSELASFRETDVWLGLITTAVGFGGLFAVYSYINPILTGLAHVGPLGLTIALSLFGVGTTVGTLLGGKLGDRYGLRAVVAEFAVVIGLLIAFTATSQHALTAVTTLVAFGMAAFTLGPAIQNRIIVAAAGVRPADSAEGAGASSGSLVSAANQGAFNLANALGASLGAFVIGQGYGYTATMWVGAGLSALGLGLVILTGLVARRRRLRGPVVRRDLALAGQH